MSAAGSGREPAERLDRRDASRTGRSTKVAWVAGVLSVISVLLLVLAELWQRRSTGYGALLPALAGIGLGLLAGVLGVAGLAVQFIRGRFARLEAALCLLGIAVAAYLLLANWW